MSGRKPATGSPINWRAASGQKIVLAVTIAEATIHEWFVEIVHDGKVKRLGAKLGEPINVPAGAFVSRCGPVEPLNLGHSISTGTAR